MLFFLLCLYSIYNLFYYYWVCLSSISSLMLFIILTNPLTSSSFWFGSFYFAALTSVCVSCGFIIDIMPMKNSLPESFFFIVSQQIIRSSTPQIKLQSLLVESPIYFRMRNNFTSEKEGVELRIRMIATHFIFYR